MSMGYITSKLLQGQPKSRTYPETANKEILKLAFAMPVEYH